MMQKPAQTASLTKKVTLIVCDGWGVADNNPGNAILKAQPAFFDYLLNHYPATLLQASSHSVGLPWGEMGNSEVGHYTIGTGRIVKQSLYRINFEIESKRFYENAAFLKTMLHVKKNKSALHIMGILGTGGVHGTTDHVFPLLEMAKRENIKNIFLHFFLDGRDSPKDSAITYLSDFEKKARKIHKNVQVASMSGRFYGMDRNNNWERIKKAYDAIVEGEAERSFKDPYKAIEESYNQEVYDERLEPTVITKGSKPVGPIRDGDGVIFFNFRPDRARQMTMAFCKDGFDGFKKGREINNLAFATFTKYVDGMNAEVAFEKEIVRNYLADVLSKNAFSQIHIAETEKYAHVTYFFNAMREVKHEGEEWVLVPSPVTQSFAEIPQMAAVEVADEMVKALFNNKHDFYLMNFAPPDMVGHTGEFDATVEAIQVVDQQLEKVVSETLKAGGVAMITADHGNAEEMHKFITDGENKEHTTNPVPFILVDDDYKDTTGPVSIEEYYLQPVTGVLADVAPTILGYYGLEPGDGMTGINLRDVIL